MNIPLVDLTPSSKTETKQILQAIQQVIHQGDFILGKAINTFEKNFAQYIGTNYCIGVDSGTDALFLSLKALGIGKGDEVILPTLTFISTASTILQTGAFPVFVDTLPQSPLLDPKQVEEKITKRTKAIIPVHMYGYVCDMTALKKIAKKYNIYLIEDACQAQGSLYKNKKSGSLGDIAAFSFYPSKNLGAFGDGGAITTSNKKVYDMLLALRDHGQKKKGRHDFLGYNSRLDTIQAAVLTIKLKQLDKKINQRRKNAAQYTSFLEKLPVTLLVEPSDSKASYHIYSILTQKRDELFSYLQKLHINCGIHYELPLHLQPALAFLNHKKGDFPNAETFTKETLSLPMYPELKKEQIAYVCSAIRKFYKA